MKRISVITMVLIFMLGISVTCFASETSITAQYDPSEMIVRISGYSNGNANVILSEVGSDAYSFDENNLPIDFFTLNTHGSFIYTFTMPKSAPAGKYDIYLKNNTSMVKTSFIYYDGAQADNLVAQLKEKTKLLDYKEFIKENAAKLGIDETDNMFSDNLNEGATLLFNCKDDFDDCKSFISCLYKYLAVSAMHGEDANAVGELIEKYEDNLGMDYSADFKENPNLSDAIKNETLNLLSSSDYYGSYSYLKKTNISVSFADVLDKLTVLARVRNAQSYSEMQNIYETYLPDILESYDGYTKNKAKDVFKLLIKKNFSEISHLEENFAASLKSVTSAESSSSGKTSGGGGGASYPSTPKVNTLPDPVTDGEQDGGDETSDGYTVSRLSSGDINYFDLSSEHWSYEAVSALSASGIISGYQDGSFKPESSITRAEFAKLMVTAFSFKGSNEKKFSDVDDEAWYAQFVNIAADNSLITGYNGIFMPESKIKRQDAILIAYRCAQRVGVTYSGTHNFDDIYSADTYAWPAIFSLAANKIISGDNTNCVNPQSEITRAEAAKLIYGLINDICVKLGK